MVKRLNIISSLIVFICCTFELYLSEKCTITNCIDCNNNNQDFCKVCDIEFGYENEYIYIQNSSLMYNKLNSNKLKTGKCIQKENIGEKMKIGEITGNLENKDVIVIKKSSLAIDNILEILGGVVVVILSIICKCCSNDQAANQTSVVEPIEINNASISVYQPPNHNQVQNEPLLPPVPSVSANVIGNNINSNNNPNVELPRNTYYNSNISTNSINDIAPAMSADVEGRYSETAGNNEFNAKKENLIKK